ncbi:putative grr1, plant [Hibiscus syriacus]|uniref:Grr1, plant n=1 Tax=Hibiscus syriacus TaxID=106335 RepID=A0A6A3BD47_HIBSY|nr:putative grr1, plant [Hibiscus syriacus]
MVTVHTFITTWVTDLLNYMCGCFGCCTKPTPIIAVDEPSKGLRIQGRVVRKPNISDDFWSSTTYEFENTALQSKELVVDQCIKPNSNLDSNGLEVVGLGIILNEFESLD